MARAENKEAAGPAARTVAGMAKKMRQRKGLTQEQLGAQMGYTGAAVSALETLAQPVSDEMLVKLEQTLGEETGIFEALRELVRLEKLPQKFRDYAPIEQKALVLSLYANHVVHGLFQTEEYARALIAGATRSRRRTGSRSWWRCEWHARPSSTDDLRARSSWSWTSRS